MVNRDAKHASPRKNVGQAMTRLAIETDEEFKHPKVPMYQAAPPLSQRFSGDHHRPHITTLPNVKLTDAMEEEHRRGIRPSLMKLRTQSDKATANRKACGKFVEEEKWSRHLVLCAGAENDLHHERSRLLRSLDFLNSWSSLLAFQVPECHFSSMQRSRVNSGNTSNVNSSTSTILIRDPGKSPTP